MNRGERPIASIRGTAAGRPPVCFYEINGTEDTADPAPFNIYNDPSWKPLIDLAAEQSDRIVMCGAGIQEEPTDPLAERTTVRTCRDEGGGRHAVRTIEAEGRVLTERTRRDPELNTTWMTGHHSHGRLRDILGLIAATGADGLDPIAPPHQGDGTLRYMRERYGRQLTLFGNLKITDIENLPETEFRAKGETALVEGTAGAGRGFVLMPSACPYGRKPGLQALRNYELMVELAEAFGG